MKYLLFGSLTLFLISCAAPIYKIDLDVASKKTESKNIKVYDQRLDQQVYITSISISGTHINMYEVNPPIKTALKGFVQSEIANLQLNTDVSIYILDLDIKNKVGFAVSDQLSCIIESSITIGENIESISVKTLSRNNENMSPFITTSGKIIIDQCLTEHARDLAKFIKKQLTISSTRPVIRRFASLHSV